MVATTPASAPDAASALPPAETNPEYPIALGLAAVRPELTASWYSSSIVAERRREHRFPCDLAAVLVPLSNPDGTLAGEPLGVRIQDLSRHGIGIAHPDPMPHRLVLVAFETAAEGAVRLVVRLKWCRFKQNDLYESGGQILRVLQPGEKANGESDGPA